MRDPERMEMVRRPEGCRIAMRLYNPGARDTVVLSGGLGCGGSDVLWRHVVDDLAADHCVVAWDYRGHGSSDRAEGSGASAIRTCAADLAAVQDEAGASTAVHVGFGVGATIVLELHRSAVRRVSALVLIQGGLSPAEGRLTVVAALRRRLLAGVASHGGISAIADGGRLRATALLHAAALRLGVVGPTCGDADFAALLAAMSGHSSAALRELARELEGHCTADVLAEVKVPTLVFGATRDALVPERLMRRVHESLHNSEYVRLPGATHACLLELGPLVAARVRRFLRERGDHLPRGG